MLKEISVVTHFYVTLFNMPSGSFAKSKGKKLFSVFFDNNSCCPFGQKLPVLDEANVIETNL